MISLNNVSLKFENKQVIDNLSFDFENRKKYAIIGESGCGKTTILNVISGLLKPQSGDVSKEPYCKIGYVFQEPRLFDWLTVLENVSSVTGLDKSNSQSKAKELLTLLGLKESLYQYPNELSGGMKQRVSIARAMAYEPDVILLDEPFKALDVETKKQVANILFNCFKDKTVIMVTHDMTDLEYVDYVLQAGPSPISSLSLVKSSM